MSLMKLSMKMRQVRNRDLGAIPNTSTITDFTYGGDIGSTVVRTFIGDNSLARVNVINANESYALAA